MSRSISPGACALAITLLGTSASTFADVQPAGMRSATDPATEGFGFDRPSPVAQRARLRMEAAIRLPSIVDPEASKAIIPVQAQPFPKEQCTRVLQPYGINPGILDLPLGLEPPTTNFREFLCMFTRRNTLRSAALGSDGAITVEIENVTLVFELKKLIETDEFYTDPLSETPGKLLYGITLLEGNGIERRPSSFAESQILMLQLIPLFGAPPA